MDLGAFDHEPCSSLVCHSLYYTSKVIPAEQLLDLNAQNGTGQTLKHKSLCRKNKEPCPSITLQACDISSFTLHSLPCLTAPSRHLADPQRTQLLNLCGKVAAVMHVGPSLSCTTPADNFSKICAVFWQQESGKMHSTVDLLAHLRFQAGIEVHLRPHRIRSPPNHGCRCSTKSCDMHTWGYTNSHASMKWCCIHGGPWQHSSNAAGGQREAWASTLHCAASCL